MPDSSAVLYQPVVHVVHVVHVVSAVPWEALNDFFHSNSAFSEFTELIFLSVGSQLPPQDIKHIELNRIEGLRAVQYHTYMHDNV